MDIQKVSDRLKQQDAPAVTDDMILVLGGAQAKNAFRWFLYTMQTHLLPKIKHKNYLSCSACLWAS